MYPAKKNVYKIQKYCYNGFIKIFTLKEEKEIWDYYSEKITKQITILLLGFLLKRKCYVAQSVEDHKRLLIIRHMIRGRVLLVRIGITFDRTSHERLLCNSANK